MRDRNDSPERRASVGALVLVAFAACTQVLGIEEARVDPELERSIGSVQGTGGTEPEVPGGEAGAPPSGQPKTLCEEYCDRMDENCSTFPQYVNRAQCLRICSFLPEGSVTSPEGNTVACRLKHASGAKYLRGSELEFACGAAGPGSEGRCGSICAGFCSIMQATCIPGETDPFSFPDMDACLETCARLPDVPPYDLDSPVLADSDTVQCRLWHVTSAAMYEREEHCEHAMGIVLCTPDLTE
ncbi:MAG TPA: hypothetical protein VKY73_01450 [Polyangiaceae bacterium]|nr:hypothetical protein [Polyangiaceae bacterium]